MCESNVYISSDESIPEERLVMENVDEIKVEGDEVILTDIVGRKKILKARVRMINLSEHKVILESLERVEK